MLGFFVGFDEGFFDDEVEQGCGGEGEHGAEGGGAGDCGGQAEGAGDGGGPDPRTPRSSSSPQTTTARKRISMVSAMVRIRA